MSIAGTIDAPLDLFGGVVTDMHGGPLALASREVLASNKLVHKELLHEFAEIEAGRVEGLPETRMSS